MRNLRRCAAFLTAAVTFSALIGTHAMAGENAISIDMTDNNDEAWANIAMANDDTVETGVNIRQSQDSDSKIVGFLYRGGAVNVLYKGDEWTEISSGKVRGYIKNEYLTYGTDAKGLAEYYGVYGAKASWNDVNLFAGESGDSSIVKTAKDGETFRLTGRSGDWMQLQTGKGGSVYVPAEDVSVVMVVDSAVAVGEEEDEAVEAQDSVFTDIEYAGTGSASASEESSYAAPSREVSYDSGSAGDTYTDTSSWEDTSAQDTGYTDTGYDSGYTDSSYDTGYTDTSYDTGYTDTSYDTGYTESYDDGSSASAQTTYVPAVTPSSAVATSGSAQELADQASRLYQEYLTAQAAADAAVANGSGEQAIMDTAAAAVAAYNSYLKAQNAADAAQWGVSTTADTSAAGYQTTQSAQTQTVQEQPQTEAPAADTSTQDIASSSASTSDVELLAALIYCEAGNQPYEGQVAVGAVVMNRVKSGSFPNTISEVIYQGGQFTPAYSGGLASALANGSGAGYIGAASEAMAGSDPTNGLLYFNNHRGSGLKIGDHWFY